MPSNSSWRARSTTVGRPTSPRSVRRWGSPAPRCTVPSGSAPLLKDRRLLRAEAVAAVDAVAHRAHRQDDQNRDGGDEDQGFHYGLRSCCCPSRAGRLWGIWVSLARRPPATSLYL